MTNKKRDIDELLKSVEQNPDNKENILLLANLLRDCGFYGQAIKWYEQRIKLDPMNVEEVWVAMLQKALCKMKDNHSFKTVQEELMYAFNIRPWRIEPIYYLIKYLREQGSVVTAYWTGRFCGLNVTNPIHDKLFIEKDIYDWKFWAEMRLCAFFSGHPDDSKEYYKRVFENHFSEEDKKTIEENLKLN